MTTTSKATHSRIAQRSMASIEELLRHDHYTVTEAAYLLDISPDILRTAVYDHSLPAFIVDHQIVSLRRHDLLEWLRAA